MELKQLPPCLRSKSSPPRASFEVCGPIEHASGRIITFMTMPENTYDVLRQKSSSRTKLWVPKIVYNVAIYTVN